ncbi:MAG: mechanosensitive ion channel domain-containing protein [Pseudomonadota bacterium]|nr:mechanosensitive ion channel domain-containing protein [Pseudomonadota bacterium]
MDEPVDDLAERIWMHVEASVTSTALYTQLAVIAVALVVATLLAMTIVRRVKLFREPPSSGALLDMKQTIHRARELVQPALHAIVLGLATQVSDSIVGENWLIRIGQGVAFVVLVYRIVTHFVNSRTANYLLTWVGLPIALLYVFGWLDAVTQMLDDVSVEIGNIHITAYAVTRTLIFGGVLFWLGRISNRTGQRVIRNQAALDVASREIVAKLFQIGLFVVIGMLLLQVMGIDVTTLVVFGGAIGVGLGFGLQQIAANFISGIIILLDRSITIGDYIELEDGRAGRLRELNMRSATLETFDGKDIMVPNERFITTAFTNWTHNNQKQRYSLDFQVAYATDIEAMLPVIRDVVASHPKVLSGPEIPLAERPDAEIKGFADSGIDILVEFWMEGIDDGENRVGADLLLMIWTTLKAHGIEIPFPQREIRLLKDA